MKQNNDKKIANFIIFLVDELGFSFKLTSEISKITREKISWLYYKYKNNYENRNKKTTIQ